jgi:hypothetical protein
MVLRMQARVARGESGTTLAPTLLSQLSMATSILLNVVALSPPSQTRSLLDLTTSDSARVWVHFTRSVCALADVLALLRFPQPAQHEALSNVVVSGVAVSLHVLLSAQSASRLDQLSVRLSGCACVAQLVKAASLVRRLSSAIANPSGEELDAWTVFSTALSRAAGLLPRE